MNQNLKCLIKACESLNIVYSIDHETNNLITVTKDNFRYIFLNLGTPLNSQSAAQLCLDKGFFYSYFKDHINIPKTISFLYPYCYEKYYEKYLKQDTIYKIIKEIKASLSYPLIVKKNRGSSGTNVFSINNQRELEKGLLTIFNENSASFDYICLAQEKIDILTEYRVIYLYGEYQFAYKKDIENANFTGNLSPLHWEGAEISLVTKSEANKLKEFCVPMFNHFSIPYCGLDVVLDRKGKFWLIEANSSPSFGHFIKSQGDSLVVDLYKSILSQL